MKFKNKFGSLVKHDSDYYIVLRQKPHNGPLVLVNSDGVKVEDLHPNDVEYVAKLPVHKVGTNLYAVDRKKNIYNPLKGRLGDSPLKTAVLKQIEAF